MVPAGMKPPGMIQHNTFFIYIQKNVQWIISIWTFHLILGQRSEPCVCKQVSSIDKDNKIKHDFQYFQSQLIPSTIWQSLAWIFSKPEAKGRWGMNSPPPKNKKTRVRNAAMFKNFFI